MIRKKNEQNNQAIAIIFCILKMIKYVLPTFQNNTQIVKNKLLF